MEIDLIFKIAAIGIIVAVLNQLLIRSGREDQAMMTTLAGLVVVLSILVKQISALFVTIKSLFALCVRRQRPLVWRLWQHCFIRCSGAVSHPTRCCFRWGRHWCFWCGSGLRSGRRSLASYAWGSRRTAQPFRA